MQHKLQIEKIGVFDSGVGGLTVLRELLQAFPLTQFVYLGDTARVPYGIRSPETIRKYSLENAFFLRSLGCQMVIVACNTATAVALPDLERELDLPVMGVILPGVQMALKTSVSGRIGVIGTEGTIRSQAYEHFLKTSNPAVQCFARATPALVPFVEEGLFMPDVLRPLLHHYLQEFRQHQIDTLILGCTHYPVIAKEIGDYFSGAIRLVDSAKAIAFALAQKFGAGLVTPPFQPLTPKICVTDLPERTLALVRRILGNDQVLVEKIFQT